MQNRPTKEELLAGVIRFLREEAVEKLEGRAKFHARVAARAADMVLRELEGERDDLGAELAGLRKLLKASGDRSEAGAADPASEVNRLSAELVRRIQAGEADEGPFREATVRLLRKTTLGRLEVINPKMAGIVRGEFGL